VRAVRVGERDPDRQRHRICLVTLRHVRERSRDRVGWCSAYIRVRHPPRARRRQRWKLNARKKTLILDTLRLRLLRVHGELRSEYNGLRGGDYLCVELKVMNIQ
jgi:hypothetical protein